MIVERRAHEILRVVQILDLAGRLVIDAAGVDDPSLAIDHPHVGGGLCVISLARRARRIEQEMGEARIETLAPVSRAFALDQALLAGRRRDDRPERSDHGWTCRQLSNATPRFAQGRSITTLSQHYGSAKESVPGWPAMQAEAPISVAARGVSRRCIMIVMAASYRGHRNATLRA
ncbi:hypothetical protein OVY29_12190 [Sphingopyxis sp. SE2]|jgi:hypothetical protein|uniref:hypothetical protein n=1 Tax=unclassified Sphingopyxis TaxID=2614943 RepID=UPI0005698953|nr:MULTISPECIES: hypothetical protein [unclassified Sphingopyxis]MDT7529425.1 hypothetical protein [Sphingopyxis sp. SE2]